MSKNNDLICDAATVPEGCHGPSDREFIDALPVGRTLATYRIEQVISQNYGHIVYLAQPITKHEKVVIKEFYPSSVVQRDDQGRVCSDDDQAGLFVSGKQNVMEMASFLMLCEHPNLVKVESVFKANNTLYLVMPFVQGQTLFEYLRSEKLLPQQKLLDLLTSLADVLTLLHSKDCLHRDLKPSNIYLMKNGQPLLLDFGTALFLGQSSSDYLPSISAGYSPIEQYALNSKEQGVWTDIYCLGATIYKAIVGNTPADAIERGQKILKELDDPYQPLLKLASDDYSLRFLSAIDHALCFRAEDRPQSISEWMAEIDGHAPVWERHKQVKKSLMAQAASRYVNIDYDLGKSR